MWGQACSLRGRYLFLHRYVTVIQLKWIEKRAHYYSLTFWKLLDLFRIAWIRVWLNGSFTLGWQINFLPNWISLSIIPAEASVTSYFIQTSYSRFRYKSMSKLMNYSLVSRNNGTRNWSTENNFASTWQVWRTVIRKVLKTISK